MQVYTTEQFPSASEQMRTHVAGQMRTHVTESPISMIDRNDAPEKGKSHQNE
jgi:hypothetical protein